MRWPVQFLLLGLIDLVPVFAATLGVAVLGEGISWHEPACGLVILAGVALSR